MTDKNEESYMKHAWHTVCIQALASERSRASQAIAVQAKHGGTAKTMHYGGKAQVMRSKGHRHARAVPLAKITGCCRSYVLPCSFS